MPVNLLQALGGSGRGSSLVPEPIEGNSLTRYLRSIQNLTGQQGTEATQMGRGLLGMGLSTLQQPTDYYSSILAGGPEMWARAAPEARTIMSQYTNAANAMQQFAPRGGGRGAAMGELPFRATSDISNLLAKVRPEAAQQLTQISAVLSQAGLSQQQIGNTLMQLTLNALLGMRGQDVQESNYIRNFIGQMLGPLVNVGASAAAGGIGKAMGLTK